MDSREASPMPTCERPTTTSAEVGYAQGQQAKLSTRERLEQTRRRLRADEAERERQDAERLRRAGDDSQDAAIRRLGAVIFTGDRSSVSIRTDHQAAFSARNATGNRLLQLQVSSSCNSTQLLIVVFSFQGDQPPNDAYNHTAPANDQRLLLPPAPALPPVPPRDTTLQLDRKTNPEPIDVRSGQLPQRSGYRERTSKPSLSLVKYVSLSICLLFLLLLGLAKLYISDLMR